MANVPSGYTYWDKSAGKNIPSGQPMPTPGDGDELYNIEDSRSKLIYRFLKAHDYYYESRYDNPNDYPEYYTKKPIPAGWEVLDNIRGYTFTNAVPFSSINGYPVVSIYWDQDYNSSVKKITLNSQIRAVCINNKKLLETIDGAIGTQLFYVYLKGCEKLKNVLDLNSAVNIQYGKGMFDSCTSLETSPSLPPNIEVIQAAFLGCSSLKNAPSIPSKVRYAGRVFKNCISLEIAPNNNSNVLIHIWEGFLNCKKLVDASNITFPSTIINANQCFENCSKLLHPPSIIRGKKLKEIFSCCSLLTTPPEFDCNEEVTLYGAFSYCESLNSIPKLPIYATDLSWCFAYCTSLNYENIVIPNSAQTVNYYCMFCGCTNLKGTFWFFPKNVSNQAVMSDSIFSGTKNDIIIESTYFKQVPFNIKTTSNNSRISIGLNVASENIYTVRCDANGNLDEKGNYVKITIQFISPIANNSKLYVPKVYLKNNQQEPILDWVLEYEQDGEIIKKTIENSTSIIEERIEANYLIEKGTFYSIFEAPSEGSSYTIKIASSCENIAYDYDNQGNYIFGTKYWNGTSGESIFTGKEYIFDIRPDGRTFKIGGAITDDEEGFIVGNPEEKYPSTFNDNVYVNGDVHATGEIEDESGNILSNKADKSEIPTEPSDVGLTIKEETVSITATKGELSSCTVRRYGRLIHMDLRVTNNQSIPTKQSMFKGTLDTVNCRPVANSRGVGYYGDTVLIGEITAAGGIAVRVTGAAVTASNPAVIPIVYLAAGD